MNIQRVLCYTTALYFWHKFMPVNVYVYAIATAVVLSNLYLNCFNNQIKKLYAFVKAKDNNNTGNRMKYIWTTITIVCSYLWYNMKRYVKVKNTCSHISMITKNKYSLSYTIRSGTYHMLIKDSNRPSFYKITRMNGEDITNKIKSYLGPRNDGHGSVIRMINIPDYHDAEYVLTHRFLGHKIVFQQDDDIIEKIKDIKFFSSSKRCVPTFSNQESKESEKLEESKESEKLEESKESEKLEESKESEKLEESKESEKLEESKESEDSKEFEKVGASKNRDEETEKKLDNIIKKMNSDKVLKLSKSQQKNWKGYFQKLSKKENHQE